MRRAFFLVGFIALFSPLHAQTSSPSASPPRSATALQAAPSLEQRVADLEAYINNSARGADTGFPMTSNVAGPGPGHNAWMMTVMMKKEKILNHCQSKFRSNHFSPTRLL